MSVVARARARASAWDGSSKLRGGRQGNGQEIPLRDPAKVVDKFILGHADAGVLDGEGVGLLVGLDHNVDILRGLCNKVAVRDGKGKMEPRT